MTAPTPLNIGVIGCGVISHAYLGTIARSPLLELRALASRQGASAREQAARYGSEAMSADALLQHPDVDLVVVLVPPALHHDFGRRAIEAGKHLFMEKPLATRLADAAALLALAKTRNRVIGCAPDTFLGDGFQSALALLAEGAIGRLTSGAIAFGSPGMEGWHPRPQPFYARGGGPLLDVGPYYLTQLVIALGPVAAVAAIGSTPHRQRHGGGHRIDVAVPTTINGALLFESGVNVSLAMSWDIVADDRAPIAFFGESGTLLAPDPNQFGGSVRLKRKSSDWQDVGKPAPVVGRDNRALKRAVEALGQGIDPLTGGPVDSETALRFGDRRGLGLIDMAQALLTDGKPRASGELAYHVLEVLLGLQASAEGAGRIAIHSRPFLPASAGTTG